MSGLREHPDESCRASLGRLTIVVLSLGLMAACQTIDGGSQTLGQIEQKRFAAMVAQDVATLEPLLAEELNYTHSSGRVENKGQFLEAIRSGSLRYESLESRQLDVRLYGKVALLTGRASARVLQSGQPQTLDLRYTDAYVFRDGRWQLVAWQSTRIP